MNDNGGKSMKRNISALVREAIKSGNDTNESIIRFVGDASDRNSILDSISNMVRTGMIEKSGYSSTAKYRIARELKEVVQKKIVDKDAWMHPYTIEQLDEVKAIANPAHKAVGAIWSALHRLPMNAKQASYVTGRGYAEVNRVMKRMASNKSLPTAELIDGWLYRLRPENVWLAARQAGMPADRWDSYIADKPACLENQAKRKPASSKNTGNAAEVKRKRAEEFAAKVDRAISRPRSIDNKDVPAETVEQFLARGGVIEQAVTEFKFERLTHKEIMNSTFRCASGYQSPASPRLSPHGLA